jgi:hypothetical protein
MQGMSYLKNMYSNAAAYWDSIKPGSKNIQSMFMRSTYGLQLLRWLVPDCTVETAEQFIKPCLENIQTLIKSDAGLDLLCQLAEHKTIAEQLVKPCSENMQILVKSQRGLDLLSKLGKLARYKDVSELTAVCVENFQLLIVSEKGLYLLRELANGGSRVAELLLKPCIEHLQTLIKSDEGLSLLSRLARYSTVAESLAKSCIEHMQILIKPGKTSLSSGAMLLCQLAEYQSCAELFAQRCVKDMEALINSDNGLYFLCGLAAHWNVAELLAKRSIEIISILIKSRGGLIFLGKLVDHKEIAGLFVQPCIENFDYIWEQQSCEKLIKGLAVDHQSIKNLVMQKIAKGYGIESKEGKISPTLLHFSRHLPLQILMKFGGDNELKNLLQDVLTKEQKLSNDYYTFVHGQRRELYLTERIYTHLWQLKKKRPLQDFFFAHVKDLVESPDAIAYDKVQKNFILSHGNYDGRDAVDARLKLLFMNYALFANSTNHGSNSAYYILKNHNSPAGRTIDISPLDPFRIFGYQKVCDQKLTRRIETLAQEYKNAGQYGNLLFIAVPKEKIHKYVYLAEGSGPKRNLYFIDQGRFIETSDIRIIMDELLNGLSRTLKDTDWVEFCLIMMQHKGGLDPNTGIKIMPILSGDPKKLAELKKKEDELLTEITQRVQDFERREQALARATVLSGHMHANAPVQIQSKL